MSPDVAIIAADHFTFESGWQDQLSNIANNIENNWNNQIANGSNQEVSVDSPPLSGHEDSVPTPSSDQSAEEYRDDIRSTVDYSTNLFDDYDSVVVRTTADMGDTLGIAYLGDTGTWGTQAAGTDHGLGVVFQTPVPGITTFHELLHTFGGRHTDGDYDDNGIWAGESSVMCITGVQGCNGNTTFRADTWDVSNCAQDAVTDYMATWDVY